MPIALLIACTFLTATAPQQAPDKAPAARVSVFSDVPKSDPAYAQLRSLHDSGVVSGDPDTLFRSRAGVATRYNFAVITFDLLQVVGATRRSGLRSGCLTVDAKMHLQGPNPLSSLALLTDEFQTELQQGYHVDTKAAQRHITSLLKKTGE